MKATILDLRRRMADVLRALDRGEKVTILRRGKRKAVLTPVPPEEGNAHAVSDHPAFGMWRDREDLADVDAAVRALRKGRSRAL